MPLKTHLVTLIIGLLLCIENIKGQLYFEPVDLGVGLNLVRDIIRDDKGYLWIANDGIGLMRYDGLQVTRFQQNGPDSTSICDNGVLCLLQDSKKNIWIGTRNGLNRFDYETQKISKFVHNATNTNSISNNNINSIYEDHQGNIWLTTDFGLNRFDAENQTFSHFIIANGDSIQNQLTNIKQDKQNSYWVAGLYPGIYAFNPNSGKFRHITDTKQSSNSTLSKTILITNDNTIWIGSRGFGIAKFNTSSETFDYLPLNTTDGLNGNLVFDMIQESDSIILIGIDQGGINRYNINTGKIEYINAKNKHSGHLTADGIYCFFKDHENILWVGTSRGGIFFSNPQRHIFKTFSQKEDDGTNSNNSLPCNIIGCFFLDKDGQIWIGTDGGGISVFNPKTLKFKNYQHDPQNPYSISSNVIRQITQDHKGNIWIATWNGGINLFDAQNHRFYPYKFNLGAKYKYLQNTIWTIKTDAKHRFWLTFPTGDVFVFDESEKILATLNSKPTTDTHFSPFTFEVEPGKVFINRKDAVFHFDNSTNQFQKAFDVPDALAFEKDRHGNYWIGTGKTGIYVCKPSGEIIQQFNTSNGLSDNYISSIIRSKNGNMWIATNNGLNYFDETTNTFSKYYKEDGLQGNQFFFQSYFQTEDGELYLGGSQGFTSFYPDKMQQNTFKPQVYITSVGYINHIKNERDNFQIVKQNIIHDDTITLNWNESSIEFEFVAVSFTYPIKNQYAYKLDGFDQNWNYTDAYKRAATYTNLNPGTYTFHVKASNNDHVWNEEGRSLVIIIKPPFWKTYLFYILILTTLFIIIYIYIIYRERKLKRDKIRLMQKVIERTHIIENQKDELNSQNQKLEQQKKELELQRDELETHRSNLELLVENRTHELLIAKNKAEEADRLKSYFLANMSHEIRTPMNAIVGFSLLLKEMDISNEEKMQYINIITSNADALLYLIEDILDFSLIEANQMKIHVEPFYINALLDTLYSSFSLRNQLSDVEIRLNNTLKDEIIILNSDEHRIRQILSNLLSNALKFTNDGFIELGTYRELNKLVFYVKDSGHGISKEDQDSIFSRFVKLEQDQTTAKRGVGLGLSISLRLALLLEGELTVESEIGIGSTFMFKMPLSQISSEKVITTTNTATYISENWKNKKILIVEDEFTNTQLFREILRKTNIQITSVEDGPSAIEVLKKDQHFDLVLLDIKLPVMDGFETFKELRKICPQQVIVAQTAYTRREDEIRIREAGFDDYLSKPINPTHLMLVLRRFFSQNNPVYNYSKSSK